MTPSDPIFALTGATIDRDGVSPDTVGMKAYNLMRIAASGLKVPPGFVIGTPVCRAYLDAGNRFPDGFLADLRQWMEKASADAGRRFGDARSPLLVSVRSGSAQSMPGMLETVLNVGLNETTVKGLIRATGNPRLAWSCYQRLVAQFASVVHGHAALPYRRLADEQRVADGLAEDEPLDWSGLRLVTRKSLGAFHALSGHAFPSDPFQQLLAAVGAVFRSWNAPKAREYRTLHGLDDSLGTAVTVQAMVFGNAGGASGSGVGFTRDPSTGAKELYMDFLLDGQGEDVVSGRSTARDAGLLQRVSPTVQASLRDACAALEATFGDMQDFEFTVEDGNLYFLQSRDGKRTPLAALRIAVDQVAEGLISKETALARLSAYDIGRLEMRRFEKPEGTAALALATPASAGVAVGRVVTDSERARDAAAKGQDVILVRTDFSTDDIAGIAAAAGILTANGARTSHAAVIARQMGKVCLVDCAGLRVDDKRGRVVLNGREFSDGHDLSLDGLTGEIFDGRLAVTTERPSSYLDEIARWNSER